ncbi:MAG: peptide-methionine (S)-S-oxide reductase [Thermoplasmata archaeon]
MLDYYRRTERVIAGLDGESVWAVPVVSEVTPTSTFHRAEEYRQDFYAQNPAHGYCRLIIAPKVAKFRK